MDFMRGRPANTTHSSAVGYDEGLRQYMLAVYNYMAGGVALTGFVAYLVANVPALMGLFYAVNPDGYLAPTALAYVAMFAPLAFLMFGMRIDNLTLSQAQTRFWIFSGLMGLSLSNIFLVFTGMSIVKVLLITAASFGGLSLYGYTTKKDLTGFGSFLVMGVWGILIASVVNMFMQSPAVHYAISFIGVFLFAGLTAYDTQAIRRSYYAVGGSAEMAGKLAVMGALKLYLDFINLFMMLLQFFGDRR